MSARVVSVWHVAAGSVAPATPSHEHARWDVYVGDDHDRFSLAGTFEGTEEEAVRAALAAEGCRAIAIPSCGSAGSVKSHAPSDGPTGGNS